MRTEAPPCYFRLFYRNPGNNQIRRTILEFCGIRPVRITCIGRVHNATATWKAQWLDKVAAFGRRAWGGGQHTPEMAGYVDGMETAVRQGHRHGKGGRPCDFF